MCSERNKRPPRRVKVKGKPGLYRVPVMKGSPFEIGYTGSDGRRHWKIVGTSQKEAEALREELRARIRRGERVAPSKATVEQVATAWLEAQTTLRPRTIEKYGSG